MYCCTDVLLQVFDNMLEDEVTPHPALYCNFLTAAGRAGNLGFARYLYQHMAVTLELPQSAPVQTRGLVPVLELEPQQLQLQQGGMAVAGFSSSSSRVQSAAGLNETGDDEEEYDQDQPDMLSLVNALLTAHAQVGALAAAVAVYKQELLGRGLQPDGYTCTALLTAAARLGNARLALSQVAEVVELTHHYGIMLSTQLGTALINAYRRVRCWQPQQPQQQQQQQLGSAGGKHSGGGGRKRGSRGASRAAAAAEAAVSSINGSSSDSLVEAAEASEQQQQQEEVAAQAAWEQQQLAAMGVPQLPGVPPVVCAALSAAEQVLEALQQYKLATSNSYVTMMCFLLEQGQVAAFKQLHARMTQQYGVAIDEQGWEKLAFAAAECGAGAIVASLQNQVQQQAVVVSPQQQALQEQQQQRLRQRQQQIAQQRQSTGAAAPVGL
jgi:hypothetical protein